MAKALVLEKFSLVGKMQGRIGKINVLVTWQGTVTSPASVKTFGTSLTCNRCHLKHVANTVCRRGRCHTWGEHSDKPELTCLLVSCHTSCTCMVILHTANLKHGSERATHRAQPHEQQ